MRSLKDHTNIEHWVLVNYGQHLLAIFARPITFGLDNDLLPRS
jgi:hypothetical protein